jgi:hypothetical protein
MVPMGVLANFLPEKISYSAACEPPAKSLSAIEPGLPQKNLEPQPLIPAEFGGFLWAIPLQSSRGLEGGCLLAVEKAVVSIPWKK